MPTLMRVLSDADVAAIHEQSVTVLAKTGMRVDSERARRTLEVAGAQVHESERRVRFPRALVEATLASARNGTSTGVGETDVVAALDEVGPAGDFLSRTETRDAVRGGEFFMPRLGYHGTFDRWEAVGRPDVLGQAREIAWKAIDGHTPFPFADGVAEELGRLELRARAATPSSSKG